MLIPLFIQLLIFALIAGIIYYIINLFPLPAPFGLIVRAVFLLLCLFVLLSFLLPFSGVSLGGPYYYRQPIR